MGILTKLSRRFLKTSSSRVSKDTLSTSSTSSEDSLYAGDSNEETYLFFSEDLDSSSRNGISFKTSIVKNTPKRNVLVNDRPASDRDDLLLLSDHDGREELFAEYCDYDSCKDEEDDIGDDIRLLGSRSLTNNRSFAYAFDQYEEEDIFEPSFEVALMDPETLLLDSPKADKTISPVELFIPPALQTEPLPHRKIKPQMRYDVYGRPFMHIFHEGLATLYEAPEGIDASAPPPRSTRSKLMHKKQSIPDYIKTQARWELTLEQMNEVDTCAGWVGILSPRSGLRSANEV